MGVRRDNLYYLKGSTVTGQVETSSSSDDGYPEAVSYTHLTLPTKRIV